MNKGWIKLHRKFLEWEWWEDINVSRVYLYLLLSANHRTKQWKSTTCSTGQVITSLATIKRQTKLSLRSVRTALEKLEATHHLTRKTTNKYTIISLSNWDKYQSQNDTQNDTPPDKRATTNKNVKEEKNINIKNPLKMNLTELKDYYQSLIKSGIKYTSTSGNDDPEYVAMLIREKEASNV